MSIVTLILLGINTIALLFCVVASSYIYRKMLDLDLDILELRKDMCGTLKHVVEIDLDIINLDNRIDGLENSINQLEIVIGDIGARTKDCSEYIKSTDDNVAEMRSDIQKILEKFNDYAYHYINAAIKNAKDINTNSLNDLIDYDKVYGKSNVKFTNETFDSEKGDE